jgi:hypothetical protein
MTTFIAKIETPRNGLLEFYFASIASPEGDKYFVTTIDQDTKSHVFYVKLDEGIWRIETSKHKIVSWILDLEPALAKLILQKT